MTLDPRSVPDLYGRLIASITDYAIFALDATGHGLNWNPGAQRFKGYTASEIIGRHFSVFYPQEAVTAGFPQYELEVAATRSFAVELAPVDIMSLFDEMLEMIEPQARARGITVTRQVPAAVPLVSADRARLAQVLSNLVTNALKFTSAGGSVSIRARRLDGVLQISVEDSGAGIPAADLPHVFDRYWRADPTSQTGSGLGLSICKGIVEAHGGRIWVESIVGRGTTFHFTVPCVND